jgi:hypothetical protein
MNIVLDKDLSAMLESDKPFTALYDLACMVQQLRNKLKEQRHEFVCDILTDGL